MSISYAGYRTGFPFPIREKNEDGDPIGFWDGTTFFSGAPSGASDRTLTVITKNYQFNNSQPWGFTFQELCFFYWRVKSLKFNVAGFLIDSYSPQSLLANFLIEDAILGSKSRPYAGFGNVKMSSESEMILPPPDDYSISSLWDSTEKNGSDIDRDFPTYSSGYDSAPVIGGWEFDNDGDVINGDLLGAISMSVDWTRTMKGSDGLYYPVLFMASVGTTDLGTPPTLMGFSTLQDSSTDSSMIFYCNFLGKSLPMCFGRGFGGGSYSSAGFSGTVTHDIEVTITANDYWSYGSKWNTSSGTPA